MTSISLPVLSLLNLATTPATAQILKTSLGADGPSGVPMTSWVDTAVPGRGVVLAVHGLVMHGGVYDAMARQLAARGYTVVAPDLRGYGHWLRKGESGRHIDYKSSHNDLVKVVSSIKSAYPNVPCFCLGESLGADMALHLASSCPDCFDGLILSAPAVHHRLFVAAILANTPMLFAQPTHQIELSTYMKKYFSSDPRIGEATVNDPLVRKRMSAYELLQSSAEVHKALDYARRVPDDLPVLVMQGSNDQMLKSESVADLFAALTSRDMSFEWFSDHGHLMLETPYVDKDAMQALNRWLDRHDHKPRKELAQVPHNAEDKVPW
jgi:acylglycerol lipase